MPRDNQNSFAGGEISPRLARRPELAKYDVSLALAKNTIVFPQGGICNRPGTKFIMETPEECLLVWFKYSILQTYVLVFGDETMRVIKDGGMVLEANKNITDATEADPVVITSTAHGYADGDIVFISSVGGMTEINNRYFKVANKTTDTFELQEINGVDVDGTAFTEYTSGGTVARVYTLATPYTSSDLRNDDGTPRLKFGRSFDVVTITSPDFAPRDLTRSGHASWTLTEISYGPAIGATASVTVTPQGSSGSTTYNYQVTAFVDETDEEGTPVGGTTSSGNATLSSSNFNRVTWSAVSGADRYYIYRQVNGVYGYIGTAVGTQFDDTGISADLDDTPPRARDPFDSTNNYPGCNTYFEQRQVYANTNNKPQTVWMTQTGRRKNLNVSTPARDDDAVTFTVASDQVNAIKSMVPLKELVILTEDGSIVARGGNGAIVPTSTIEVKPQEGQGASDVPPIVAGKDVLYVQNGGRRVRALGYTFDSDSYTGPDLMLLAEHLLEDRTIIDWGYQKKPDSLVWAVTSDGEGLVLTYVQDQQVYAWCRYVTDGQIKSVACITEDGRDALYQQVLRRIDGVNRYYLERMERRIDDDIKDCFFLDCGLSYDSPVAITGATAADPVVVTAVAHGFSDGDLVDIVSIEGMTELNGRRFKVANKTTDTFELTNPDDDEDIDGGDYTAYVSGGYVRKAVSTVSGLWHLEGMEVQILADGNVEPAQTVANGAITISQPASRIHVGLGYVSDIETLSPDTTDGRATAKKKNVTKAIAAVLRSRGIEAGPTFDDMVEVKQREFEDMGDPIALKTGFFEMQVSSQFGYEGKTCIRQSYPLPLTILALSLEVVVGD